MTTHDPAYLDACARKLDASLWPVLDAFCARKGITRAELLAMPHPATTLVGHDPAASQPPLTPATATVAAGSDTPVAGRAATETTIRGALAPCDETVSKREGIAGEYAPSHGVGRCHVGSGGANPERRPATGATRAAAKSAGRPGLRPESHRPGTECPVGGRAAGSPDANKRKRPSGATEERLDLTA